MARRSRLLVRVSSHWRTSLDLYCRSSPGHLPVVGQGSSRSAERPGGCKSRIRNHHLRPSPEKRGNGLKFVKKSLSTTSGGGLACISGIGRVSYGDDGEK